MRSIPEVVVSPFTPYPKEAGEIATYSALFRTDTQLDVVLDLGLASYTEADPDRPFTVLSVGASYGAEADSVLVYVEQAAPAIGSITLRGIDTNGKAVKQAKQAKYTAHISEVNGLNMFKVDPNPDNTEQLIIDTSDLRSRHNVAFDEADLTKDKLNLPLADVVLCNNVLFHLTPEGAEELVNSMTPYLAVGGIISFGANPAQVRMSGNRHEATNYPQWRRQIANKLSQEGIEPVLHDVRRKAPFAFQRASQGKVDNAF